MPAVVSQATRAMFMRAPAQSQRARMARTLVEAQMYVCWHPDFGLAEMPADYGRPSVTMSAAALDL